MSTSAQRQRAPDTIPNSSMHPATRLTARSSFGYISAERTALAKPLTQPLPTPGPARQDQKKREMLKLRQQRHRSVLQHAAGLVIVVGAMGAAFLYGHVQLAREAQRSVIVSDMLNQEVEKSRLLGNAQARDVTPTSINRKATIVGMVHPEERDSIVLP